MMKRMGSILMLLAILAVPAQAQRQGRMRGPARPDGFGARGRTPNPSADDIIRLQERLGLSEEQVERVKDAQRSDREARDALRETLNGILTDEQRSQMRSLQRQANRGRSVRRGGPAAGRARARFDRGFRATRRPGRSWR